MFTHHDQFWGSPNRLTHDVFGSSRLQKLNPHLQHRTINCETQKQSRLYHVVRICVVLPHVLFSCRQRRNFDSRQKQIHEPIAKNTRITKRPETTNCLRNNYFAIPILPIRPKIRTFYGIENATEHWQMSGSSNLLTQHVTGTFVCINLNLICQIETKIAKRKTNNIWNTLSTYLCCFCNKWCVLPPKRNFTVWNQRNSTKHLPNTFWSTHGPKQQFVCGNDHFAISMLGQQIPPPPKFEHHVTPAISPTTGKFWVWSTVWRKLFW